MAKSQYVFSFESAINKKQNLFDLVLDFPIVGEQKLSLSLDPRVVSQDIGKTQLVEILKERLGDQADHEQIIKGIREFFIFTSDFLNYRSRGVYPNHFKSKFEDEHFIMERSTPHYKFMIDNFAASESFYTRTIYKIFLTTKSINDPIMTLFLVPEACDK